MSEERTRRWRLVLGGGEADGTDYSLDGRDVGMDRSLTALYDSDRAGTLGSSSPNVPRWLGDIRTYFPSSVVRVMQHDALNRLGMKQMLLQPEMLSSMQPDVNLVASLLSLSAVIPARTRETARMVVRKVVEQLEERLASPLRQSVTGSIQRGGRNRRPRLREMDWHRTIHANLKHYQPEEKTVIPETLIGYRRKRSSIQDIILCIDQSGSMATSVVHASVCGAVLASLPSISTRVVVFDTSVVDLTEHLSDPVEMLFGVQLGGGTDIHQAIAYCQTLVTRPADTTLVLISDLFEGGNVEQMLGRVAELVHSGVTVIALLALNDQGAPSFDHDVAAALASLGVPAFACTPDQFPDLMAAALRKDDVAAWASERGLVTSRAE